MDFLRLLFEPAVLLFTAPVLLVLTFWLVALPGLLGVDLFTLEADAEVEAGGAAAWLGLGLLPLSLLLSLLLFCFGWTGIALHGFFGAALTALGWSGMVQNLLFVPAALVAATAVTAGAARLLHPLFRDYGPAPGAFDPLGRVAVVTSSTVTPTFGTATVRTDGGPADIAIHTDDTAAPPRYGDEVLVVDYDPAAHTYLVAPLTPDAEARPAAGAPIR